MFHFAETVRVEPVGSNQFRAAAEQSELIIEFAPAASVQCTRGSTHPIGGWVSRGYHQKRPTTTLACRLVFEGDCKITTQINVIPLLGSEFAGRGKQQCQAI